MIDLLLIRIRNYSLRRKLLLVLMLTIGSVLMAAAILLSINEAITSHQAEKDDLSSLCDIVAKNVAAALLFNDRNAAKDTLSGLSAQTEIFSAVIIKSDRQILADFQSSPSSRRPYDVIEDSEGRVLMSEKSFDIYMAKMKRSWDWELDIEVIRPIVLDQELRGWVIICSDLSKFFRKFSGFVATIVLGLVIALLFAYSLAKRFQQIITGPILNLAETMRSISGTMNYAVKVEKISSDEIGVMIDSFNDMLEQVRSRDDQLRGQQDELQKSESKFREISRQFNALLDAMPDSITLLSSDLGILWANQAATDRMDTGIKEKSGHHCYRAWFGRSVPCDPCPVEKSFQSGEPSLETITTTDSKTWEIRAIPVKEQGQGGVVNVIEVGRDITEQRNLEGQLQQAQKMESIGRFAGGIAHDLNNILSIVIGYSEMCLTLSLYDKRLPEYLKDIINAGEKAASLTRQILAFSRKQVLEMKPLNLNVVIEQTEKMISRLIGEDIMVTYQPEKHLRNIMADASQLEQVILNLAVNARDAMPQGGMLTITTAVAVLDETHGLDNRTPPPGEYVLVTVSDTGVGMTPEILKNIFEPFFTTKERGKGTGLGLATVFGIVKQHHGYIYVESEPGKWTMFKIYFPATEEAQTAEDRLEHLAEILGGTETILVVDDDSSLRRLATTLLQSVGYQVFEASGVETALEVSRSLQGPLHLLLTDVVMPHKNGREVAEMIKAERPAIKVLFMSGYTDDIIARNGILESGAAFLQKPITREALIRKVRQVLDSENTGSIPAPMLPSGRKLSILIADDDKTTYKLVKLQVSFIAETVEHAENGQVAVDKFKSRPFDLVIMDMLMPLKDGCTAVEEIRSWEGQNGRRPTPIIMLTGNTSKEDLQKCSAAGCTVSVTKPVYRDTLLQTIDACITRVSGAPPQDSPDKKRAEIVRADSLLQDLIPKYLQARRDDVPAMEEALTRNDFDRIRLIGHSMKGSGGSYGFDPISSIGKEIEQAAKNSDTEMLVQWMGRLTAYLESVEVTYE